MTDGETKEWDAHEEVRNLVEETDDLNELYRSIGYSPYRHEEAKRNLGKLKLLTHGGRVKDSTAFADALQEIERPFRNGWVPQPEVILQDVLACVADCRKEWERDKGIAPYLGTLEREVTNICITLGHDEAALKKKSQLDDLLWNFVYVRHKYKPDDPYFREVYLEQAKKYVDVAWMHSQWITNHLLTNLLHSELAPFQKTANWPYEHPWALMILFALSALAVRLSSSFWPFVLILLAVGCWDYVKAVRKIRLLHPIYQEILSGNYDGSEISRRLQRLEEKGHHVPTLFYPLLRLAASAGTAPG